VGSPAPQNLLQAMAAEVLMGVKARVVAVRMGKLVVCTKTRAVKVSCRAALADRLIKAVVQ